MANAPSGRDSRSRGRRRRCRSRCCLRQVPRPWSSLLRCRLRRRGRRRCRRRRRRRCRLRRSWSTVRRCPSPCPQRSSPGRCGRSRRHRGGSSRRHCRSRHPRSWSPAPCCRNRWCRPGSRGSQTPNPKRRPQRCPSARRSTSGVTPPSRRRCSRRSLHRLRPDRRDRASPNAPRQPARGVSSSGSSRSCSGPRVLLPSERLSAAVMTTTSSHRLRVL